MTLQNPLHTLLQFSPNAANLVGAYSAGQGILQQGLQNRQMELQTQGLERQENIINTVNRLQELERQIGAGATQEQLAGTLQNFIAESQQRGGNPIDSIQALQALQQGGVEGLSGILGQAKQVFQDQGLIQAPGLSEERKLDILGQQKLELEKLKGEQAQNMERLKLELGANEDAMKQADALRKEVVDVSNRLQFDDTKSAFSRIQASNDGTPAGDLALIFNYMKMLDPGSTVREGEFATAQNATGVEGQIRNLYNRIMSGERLSPEQRQNFTQQAEKIFDKSQANFEQAIKPILNIGKSRNLSQDDILGAGYFESLQPANAPTEVVIQEHPQFGNITEEDILETMRANNMTRQEVMKALQGM